MSQTCDELAPLLAARPLDVLDADERTALEDHVRLCATCRTRTVLGDEALARAAPPEQRAPASNWEKIAARIEQASVPHVTPRITVKLACTYCHASLVRDEAAYCATCLAPHHAEC